MAWTPEGGQSADRSSVTAGQHCENMLAGLLMHSASSRAHLALPELVSRCCCAQLAALSSLRMYVAKDLRQPEPRAAAVAQLMEVLRRFPSGPPVRTFHFSARPTGCLLQTLRSVPSMTPFASASFDAVRAAEWQIPVQMPGSGSFGLATLRM